MTSQSDFVNVYVANVNALDDSKLFDEAYNVVPAFRQEKVDKQRFHRGKKLSLGAGLLLDYALKGIGLNPANAEIVYDENEKPYIKGCNIFFNLSHSEDYAMCAISNLEIGCDIEQIKEIDMKIAKRFFAESEYQDIMKKQNVSERTNLFYRYWTLKESFMKNTGLGLKLPLSDFQIKIADDISIVQSVNENQYYFQEFSNIPGYKCAICMAMPIKSVKMNLIDFNNII